MNPSRFGFSPMEKAVVETGDLGFPHPHYKIDHYDQSMRIDFYLIRVCPFFLFLRSRGEKRRDYRARFNQGLNAEKTTRVASIFNIGFNAGWV
ncbi:hypothetical protein QL285_083944 [Trifolium repens]|nr:hypothetical protein QL285_083944 [Trifolium repens]